MDVYLCSMLVVTGCDFFPSEGGGGLHSKVKCVRLCVCGGSVVVCSRSSGQATCEQSKRGMEDMFWDEPWGETETETLTCKKTNVSTFTATYGLSSIAEDLRLLNMHLQHFLCHDLQWKHKHECIRTMRCKKIKIKKEEGKNNVCCRMKQTNG